MIQQYLPPFSYGLTLKERVCSLQRGLFPLSLNGKGPITIEANTVLFQLSPFKEWWYPYTKRSWNTVFLMHFCPVCSQLIVPTFRTIKEIILDVPISRNFRANLLYRTKADNQHTEACEAFSKQTKISNS